jgi:hypothetical protein
MRRAASSSALMPKAEQEWPMAEPHVPEKKRRRRFSATCKLHVLREAGRCTAPGKVAALRRREGLYFSHLVSWRRQQEWGARWLHSR